MNSLSWSSSLLELATNKKPTQSLLKIHDGGIKTIKDLIWILPLRMQEAPKLSEFSELIPEKLFLGKAKLISIRFTPAFGKRGKGKIQLFNADCVIKDAFSEKYLNLKWFNTYPSLKKQLENMNGFTFMGTVNEYKGTLQIVNPKINPKELHDSGDSVLIEYPTINTAPGKQLKTIINKIPRYLWDNIDSILPKNLEKDFDLLSLAESFQRLHGKLKYDEDSIEFAKTRLIYEEFLSNQLKVFARKLKNKKLKAPKLKITDEFLIESKKIFPYNLTQDQNKVLGHIVQDFKSENPMMRMIQGDVGCGKTSIALLASLIAIDNLGQVALMCPTEALANQHSKTFSELLPKKINIALLLGSTKAKDKKSIYAQLLNGEIDLIIGTHSLIQQSVEFKNLNLAIIDEQHKFGVEQRQKLSAKGHFVNTLIMTATPIPRSLQLAQYGDLDISTIRNMPGGRKGIKSRIVTPKTYEKYLSFLKTRMSLGEQIYVVVPAIEESETLNLKNVNTLIETYKNYFPEYKISALHGQLKPSEKQEIMNQYSNGDINLLISTTVIEVGINVLNSTVISIYNPDRFGLSSLHQLRGRVGRGDKPGFCFLIADKNVSNESMNRIRIIEKTIDGFEIAEADLVNRGQGDLFGASQSGHISSFKLANIVEHFDIFEKVTQDFETLKLEQTEFVNNIILDLLDDTKVSTTI